MNTSPRIPKTRTFGKNSNLVKAHCAAEALRPEAEAHDPYQQRLDLELSRPGLETAGLPYSREIPVVRGWINPMRVIVERPTIAARHTDDDLINSALNFRTDTANLFTSMNDLAVDIYPTPAGVEPLMKISRNGHHRRMEYAMLGLPVVAAEVQDLNHDVWVFSAKNSAWLPFMNSLGLSTSKPEDDGQFFRVQDPTRCVGWVLPPAEEGDMPTKIADVTDVILRRMARLESVTGPLSDPRVDVLRSRPKLNAALAKHLGWSRFALWIVQRVRPLERKIDAVFDKRSAEHQSS